MTTATFDYYFKTLIKLQKHYENWLVVFAKLLTKQPVTQAHLKSGIRLSSVPNNTLTEIIDEICIQKVYTPKFLPLRKKPVIVDVGANVGVFSVFVSKQLSARVIAIEPLPENIPLLKKNLYQNNCRTVTVEAAALASAKGKQKLHVGRFTSVGTLIENADSMGTISVKTITLNDVFQLHNLDTIDLLKLDCEGAEGEIIATLTPAQAKKISAIALEYHDHISQLHHSEILKGLKKLQYNTKLIEQKNSPLGYIYAWHA